MKRRPTAPGEILSEEFMKPLGLSQKELSEHIGCDYKVINRIVNERASVTPRMAVMLSAAFDTTPDFWLNAQMSIDLWELRDLTKNPKVRPIIRRTRRKTKTTV